MTTPLPGERRSGLETLSTETLLLLYERMLGPLDPAAKRRMLHTARARGWDRTPDVTRLAA
jgi:hypothetical protein